MTHPPLSKWFNVKGNNWSLIKHLIGWIRPTPWRVLCNCKWSKVRIKIMNWYDFSSFILMWFENGSNSFRCHLNIDHGTIQTCSESIIVRVWLLFDVYWMELRTGITAISFWNESSENSGCGMKCMTFLHCLVTFHCFALFCPVITLFPTRIAIILSGWIWDAARITLYSTLKYNSEICISAPNDWFKNDTLDGVFGSESVSLFRFGSGTTNVLFCVFDMENKMAWFARCWWLLRFFLSAI